MKSTVPHLQINMQRHEERGQDSSPIANAMYSNGNMTYCAITVQVLAGCCQHWVGYHGYGYNVSIDGFVQDCSNSIANALELLQSYTKPSICVCARV